MSNIEQNICDAIEIITNKAIAGAGFDRTIQGSILSCIDEATGKYKVRYQDSNIIAFSTDIEKKYNRGTQVYVLVPCNDMSKKKTIIGEVGENVVYDPNNEDTLGQVIYERNSENLINLYYSTAAYGDTYEVGVNSKSIYNQDNRYGETYCPYVERDNSGTPLAIIDFIDEEIIKDYIKYSSLFYLGANFRTNFEEDIIERGNYGIKVFMDCEDEEGNIAELSMTLDITNGIDGTYYHLKNNSYKFYTFEIPKNFKKFNRVEIFVTDFADEEDRTPSGFYDPDIIVSDIGLYTANRVSDLIAGTGITLTYPKGKSIKKVNNVLDVVSNLAVKASIVENSKLVNEDQFSFYWYKRDLSVYAEGIESYDGNYGKRGWYCLNDKNEAGLISAKSEFEFSTQDYLTSKNNEFKVIAVKVSGTSTTKYERTFILNNYNYDFEEVIILSNKCQQFLLNNRINDLDLYCKVINNGVEISPENSYINDYGFFWYAKVDNVEFYGNEILDRFSPSNDVKTEFVGLRGTSLQEFPNGDNGRRIENISLGRVANLSAGVTFGCTVKKKVSGKLITLTTVTQRIALEQYTLKYGLQITEKNQSFIYNTKLMSPYSNGVGAPRQLGLILTDNQTGQDINIEEEIRQGRLEVIWTAPAENTLIVNPHGANDITVNGKTYYPNYEFQIAENFSYDKLDDNTITATVIYDGCNIKDRTQFLFNVQGMYGTNGTEYSAIIGLANGHAMPRWVVCTMYGTYTDDEDSRTYSLSTMGYFNFSMGDGWVDAEVFNDAENSRYPIFTNQYKQLPFEVQLYKNGELVSSDRIVKKKWYMKTLSYGSPEKEVESNFIIAENQEVDGSEVPWAIKYKNVLYEDGNKYNIDNDRQLMPSNILCCKVDYKIEATENMEEKTLTTYAYLPIVTTVNRVLSSMNITPANMPKIEFDINTGYNEVIYTDDGCKASYPGINNTFSIKLDSELWRTQGKFKVVGVNGRTEGSNYTWLRANNLIIEKTKSVTKDGVNYRNAIVNPVYSFMGESTSNGILFTYQHEKTQDGTLLYAIDSYIHIPICLHLNSYSKEAFNDWDGVSIDINNEGGYIIAPQVIAGRKEQDNSFTGVMMGEAKDNSQKDLHPGIYSYYHGDKTFGVYADSGFAFFGKKNTGQIIVDPSNVDDKGQVREGCYLYSSGFFKDGARDSELGRVKAEALDNVDKYINPHTKTRLSDNIKNNYYNDSGMFIDMTDGGIYYGTGAFSVDKNGNMISKGGHIWNGILTDMSYPQNLSDKEDAYLDLNSSVEDYDCVLKYKDQLRIFKGDGAILSAGGHFSNKDGSMFIDFQKDNDSAYITLLDENGRTLFKRDSSINLTNVPMDERYDSTMALYPQKLTGFLLNCSSGTTLNEFKSINNLKFAITKSGNIIAKKGKIGSFYLDENYFKTNPKNPGDQGGHIRGDITLAKTDFTLNNFTTVNFTFSQEEGYNNIITSTNVLHNQSVPYLRFAIGTELAATSNGELYCQTIFNNIIYSAEVTAANLIGYEIYGNTIEVKTLNCLNNLSATSAHISTFTSGFTVNGGTTFNGDVTISSSNSLIANGTAQMQHLETDNLYVKQILPHPDILSSTIIIGDPNSNSGTPILLSNDVTQLEDRNYTLPWMRATTSFSEGSSLPTGHIVLVYQN